MAKNNTPKLEESEIRRIVSEELDKKAKFWLKVAGTASLILGLGFIPQVREELVTRAHNMYYNSANTNDIVAVYHSDFLLSKTPGDNGRNLSKVMRFKAGPNQRIRLYIETIELNDSKKYLKLMLNKNPINCLDKNTKAMCELKVVDLAASGTNSGINILDQGFNTLSFEFTDTIENFESINLDLNISCIVFVYGKTD